MSGIGILLVLILISALPVIVVWIWFSLGRIPLRLSWFLASLLGGVLSLPAAGFLQWLFPPIAVTGLGSLLVRLFLQIALTEEVGRLAILAALFAALRRFNRPTRDSPPALSESQAAAAGLVTGLGFAIIETVSYGSASLGIALLRAFTAAPLHGACGSRVAGAVYHFRTRPVFAASRFIAAVFIHGLFNFMVIRPGIPAFIPLILTAAVLLPALRIIGRGAAGRGIDRGDAA